MMSVVRIRTTEPRYGWYQVNVAKGPPSANTQAVKAMQAVTQWKVLHQAKPGGSVFL
jgi:hypothetical protein